MLSHVKISKMIPQKQSLVGWSPFLPFPLLFSDEWPNSFGPPYLLSMSQKGLWEVWLISIKTWWTGQARDRDERFLSSLCHSFSSDIQVLVLKLYHIIQHTDYIALCNGSKGGLCQAMVIHVIVNTSLSWNILASISEVKGLTQLAGRGSSCLCFLSWGMSEQLMSQCLFTWTQEPSWKLPIHLRIAFFPDTGLKNAKSGQRRNQPYTFLPNVKRPDVWVVAWICIRATFSSTSSVPNCLRSFQNPFHSNLYGHSEFVSPPSWFLNPFLLQIKWHISGTLIMGPDFCQEIWIS